MVGWKWGLLLGAFLVILSAVILLVVFLFSPGEDPVIDTLPSAGSGNAGAATGDEAPSEEVERRAIDRLNKALEGGELEEILRVLAAALIEGLPIHEGAGQVFDSALPLETKVRLLEFLAGIETCQPMERVTIAWYFHHLGVEGKSTPCLARAVSLIPDQVWFLRDLLEADPKGAIEALSALDPARMTNPFALSLLIGFLAERKEGTLLARFAGRLFELQPTNRLAFRSLLELDPETLMEKLEKEVQARPKDPRAWAGWAMAQLAAGRQGDAFEAFRKAADLDPGNPDYFQGLIEADPGRAAEVLGKYYEERPEDSEAAGKFGRALIAAGRREEAFGVLLDALKQEPEDPEWMDLLLEIEPARTRETLKEWIRKDPENGLLHGIMGRALVEAGDRQGGFEAYARAFELEGLVVWAHGMVEADPARALPELKKALRFTPEKFDSIRARLASPDAPPDPIEVFGRMRSGDCHLLGELGLALVETGNARDGLSMIEFALDSGHVMGEQASVLIGALGRADPERGCCLLEAMACDAGTDPEAWGSVGDGYRAMGRILDALQAFEKARTLEPTNEEWITAIRELTTRGR